MPQRHSGRYLSIATIRIACDTKVPQHEKYRREAFEVAPRYNFGYYSKEDMVQHAIERTLDILQKGKFRPRSDKDLIKQLAAFVRVHMRNRCLNLIRDESCRYSSKDTEINKSKYNLMHPLYIYNQNFNEDFFVQEDNNREELHDCLDYIRTNLSDDMISDLDTIRDGKKISISKQKRLMAAIQRLFAEEDSEEETSI